MKKCSKSFISIMLSLLTLFLCAVPAAAVIRGDVDNDGKVTAADARIVLRASVGLEELTPLQRFTANIDSDKEITAADARYILRASVENYNPIKPEPNPRFEKILYETAHPLLGKTKPAFPNNFQKWCCVYTINDVFRPALKTAGYSDSQIDLLAPTKFSRDTLSKAVSHLLNVTWPPLFILTGMDIYVPSILADYYLDSPSAAKTYVFYDYYDDVVEDKPILRDSISANTYYPKVGDVMFMSNKTRTYEKGYPTIDHTAQIIEVYDDGSFLCTEGSIIDPSEGDGRARVRERKYVYNAGLGTYEYSQNTKIVCLLAARPNL